MLLAPLTLFAQRSDRSLQEAQVKAAVGIIAATKRAHAEVILRDLREIEGKVINVYDDSFVIRPKRRKTPSLGVQRAGIYTIRYSDVLQLEGKDVAISFVPDPASSPYAGWHEVKAVGTGEFVQLYLKDGRRAHGVMLKATDDSVSIMSGNKKAELERSNIARVYRVTGDTSTMLSRLTKGGERGAEIADILLPIMDAAARAALPGLALGAGIGVATVILIYMLPKGGTKRVLVYAL